MRQKSFYDRISSAYDLIADSSEHTAREKGLKLLAVSAGETVLVIGFGTGHSVVSVAQAVTPTGKAFGIDISQGMMDVAQKRIVEAGVAEQVKLSLGDARDLQFSDQQFDAVFISFTLELFDDVDLPRVLQEIRRVLRPNGRLGVVSMLVEEHKSVMTDIYISMHRHFPHFVDCHPIAVSGLLLAAGFTVEHFDRMSIWGLPVGIALAKKPNQ